MAESGDSTLHQSQTLESVGQGSRSLAGGTGRGLSAHDLRGEPGSDRAGAAWVCAQMEAALPSAVSELRGSRRPTFYFYGFSRLAVEGAAHQNPSFTA